MSANSNSDRRVDDVDHDDAESNNDLPLLETLSSVDAIKTVQLKILNTLHIYPKISPSMLNTGIGPAIPPAIWRPALQHLIEQGLVTESQVNRLGITGRSNTLRTVELTDVGRAHADRQFSALDSSAAAGSLIPSGQGRE